MSNVNSEVRLKEIFKELKNCASKKCKLNKLNFKQYPAKEKELQQVLQLEYELKLERQRIQQPKKTFTTLTSDDIATLDFEETRRALDSIRSKLSNERYSEDQSAFNDATAIHELLLEHREKLQPTQKFTKAMLHEILQQDPEPDTWLHQKLAELLK